MMTIENPRSVLHHLAPMAVGTGQVESLTSYFCRLAQSHSASSRDLAAWILRRQGQKVPDDYRWFRRTFSCASNATESWAAWIAELTGTEGLDRLTLLPWRHVISGGYLTSRLDRWCPCCYTSDLEAKRPPYFRLLWDLRAVDACPEHRVQLVHQCPHCMKKNVRHRATMVLPSYCTRCTKFLGDERAVPATPTQLAVAKQAALMLSSQPEVGPGGVVSILDEILFAHSGNNIAVFAREIGMSKSAVWHWLHGSGVPTLQAWLAISLKTGLSMEALFSSSVKDWNPSYKSPQLPLPLGRSPRKEIKSRKIDWTQKRQELEALLLAEPPISLARACKKIDVDQKVVYQNANKQARQLVARFERHEQNKRAEKVIDLTSRLKLMQEHQMRIGRAGFSARDAWKVLPRHARSVRHVFRHISEVVNSNDA
ncbi:TniQ family protein [Parapusillimonas sp. SGNA-6]|nr:TniQ family protein [Parapusillimonas sp. SGNA-6]